MSDSLASAVEPEELRVLLTAYRREKWHRIQTPEWQERVVEQTLRADFGDLFQGLASRARVPERARVLDVGSGVGTFVAWARRRGYRAFGIEPDRIGVEGRLGALQIARRQAGSPAFVRGIGEHLPFADDKFDLVTLHQVLEHVGDQEAVLRECLRVTRPGGAVYFSCPNYLRFWEPHYKIAWLPLLPRTVARWYLVARGRDPVLLEQITYTHHRKIQSLLGRLAAIAEFIDLHGEELRTKLLGGGKFLSLRGRAAKHLATLPRIGRTMERTLLALQRACDAGLEYVLIKRPRSTALSGT